MTRTTAAQQVALLPEIARWATHPELRFPASAQHEARLCLLDTLACMAAGGREPLVRKTLEAMTGASGDAAAGPAATALDEVRLAAPAAALVNGIAAHVLDFDDYDVPASTHPSAVIVPALLAVSDLRRVSFGALLTAYLVGYEVIVAIGRALGGYRHYEAGWHATSTIGPIAAAAAAAKLIALDDERFAMAMALAASSSAGLKAQFGSDAKPLHAGLAARAGLEAALLAEAGVTANPTLMEGGFGFVARYGAATTSAAPASAGGPAYDAACAMQTDPVLRKPWPCCAYTHRGIEAALRLAHRPGFDAAAITRGTIRVPEPFFRVAPFREPENPAQARFSLLYCVAAALTDREVAPASFAPVAIARPEMRALIRRFEIDAYDAGPKLEDMSPEHPDSVSLRLEDGSAASVTVANVKGAARNPMCEADLRDKFASCGGAPALAERLLSGTTEADWRFSDEQWTA